MSAKSRSNPSATERSTYKEFVRPEGFEPPTFRSVAGRSNPLSYGRKTMPTD